MTPSELAKVERNLQLTFDNDRIRLAAEMDEEGGHAVDLVEDDGSLTYLGAVEKVDDPAGYAFVMFITQEEIEEMG